VRLFVFSRQVSFRWKEEEDALEDEDAGRDLGVVRDIVGAGVEVYLGASGR